MLSHLNNRSEDHDETTDNGSSFNHSLIYSNYNRPERLLNERTNEGKSQAYLPMQMRKNLTDMKHETNSLKMNQSLNSINLKDIRNIKYLESTWFKLKNGQLENPQL